MSSTPADQTEAFTAFLESMEDRLSSFVAHGLPETVTVGDDERSFVKDLSPASLPWIEAYAVSRLPSPALASAPANQRLAEDLMRYVGETFIRALGGSWQHDPDGTDHGMPFVRVPSPTDQTTDVSVLGLLMTALQQRTGDVFISAFLRTADADSDAGQGTGSDAGRAAGSDAGHAADESSTADDEDAPAGP